MKSELLSLVLRDDRVGKITRPCPFCTRKYERMSGFFGLWTLSKKPFENIEGKRENAANQHFLLYPIGKKRKCC